MASSPSILSFPSIHLYIVNPIGNKLACAHELSSYISGYFSIDQLRTVIGRPPDVEYELTTHTPECRFASWLLDFNEVNILYTSATPASGKLLLEDLNDILGQYPHTEYRYSLVADFP